MEEVAVFYTALSSVILLLVFFKLFISRASHKNLPPSPSSIPILGHFHLLKQPLHRALRDLSKKYGPIISLKFGSRLVVVVSSPSIVEECFNKNDTVLANRPRLMIGKYMNYDFTDLITSPHGDHWRNLRRIAAAEIFSSNSLNLFVNDRKDEIKQLLKKLSRDSLVNFAQVELKAAFYDLALNNITRMTAGRRYYGEDVSDKADARQFRELILKIVKYGAASNPADFFPFLKWINYGNYEKEIKELTNAMDGRLQRMIDEHRGKEEGNTMIDRLLSSQKSEPQYYTDIIIKGLIKDFLMAGSDIVVVTLEWALSALLNHPDVLKKAKEELDAEVGQENLIDEQHISKLPYLRNIISETLRLYPGAPLLVPHMPSEDCTIGGYNVPRDTMVLVNAWAIHRDPKSWDDPLVFKPERFENIVEVEGYGYKFMPFGLGRRACPGSSLAHRILGMALGSLIQCFEWKRVDEEEIDMTEGNGLTMPKAQPLVALFRARPIMSKVLDGAI